MSNPFKIGDRIAWSNVDPRPDAAIRVQSHPREDYGEGPFMVEGVKPHLAPQRGELHDPKDTAQVQIRVVLPVRKHIRDTPQESVCSFAARWFIALK